MGKRLAILVGAVLVGGWASAVAGATSPPSKPIILEQEIGFTYRPYQFNRQFPGELIPMYIRLLPPLHIASSNWRVVIPVGGRFGFKSRPKCPESYPHCVFPERGRYNQPVYPATSPTGFEAIGVGKAVVTVTSRHGRQVYDVTTARALPNGDYFAFNGHYSGHRPHG